MSPAAQRAYDEFIAAHRAECRRWWNASYNELEDVIEARRREIAERRLRNESLWFCEVPYCESLARCEQAPICQVHDRRMHKLIGYPDGAE